MNGVSIRLREIADQIDEHNDGERPSHEAGRVPYHPTFKNLDFGAIADQMYKARRTREKLFGIAGLFSDPAWDILLDLLINENRMSRVSVTSACIASCVPATTALRWLSTLEEYGLVERHQDAADARRTFIALTKLGRQKTCEALFSALNSSSRLKQL